MTHATGTGNVPATDSGTQPGSGFFAAFGRFIVRNPWKVIAAWIVIAWWPGHGDQ